MSSTPARGRPAASIPCLQDCFCHRREHSTTNTTKDGLHFGFFMLKTTYRRRSRVQTVSQATEIVSYVLGLPRNRVAQAARVLLNADLLPKSVGRDVKKIDGGELLLLIAGAAMAERSVDAAKVAKEFGDLPFQTGDTDGEGQSLRELFAMAMDPEKGWSRTSLELSRTAEGVTATIDTAIRTETHEIEMTLPFWRSKSWGGWAKTSFTISDDGLEIMRNLFKREDAEGTSYALNANAVEA